MALYSEYLYINFDYFKYSLNSRWLNNRINTISVDSNKYDCGFIKDKVIWCDLLEIKFICNRLYMRHHLAAFHFLM